MTMHIRFLGAAGTVTGSRSLVEGGGARLLVDCGLFQGLKSLRLRNWRPFDVDPSSLDAVVLTHAHLDHSGWLPRLVKLGFRGPVICTPATAALCRLLLLDSGHLQEEDAKHANRHRWSKHDPALPLYDRKDAERSLEWFEPLEWDTPRRVGDLEIGLHPAGHILGASTVHVRRGDRVAWFSGDLGRPDDLVMRPPRPVTATDLLVLESTYGDRHHSDEDPMEVLATIVRDTSARGGVVLVPAFAVGRSQALLRALQLLKQRGEIPDLPVYLDSPMAVNATELYVQNADQHRLTDEEAAALWEAVALSRTAEDSKAIDRRSGPMVVVSAAGMLTGGRVLHHLRTFARDPDNTLLFSGFQAAGTRGAHILAGAREVKVHGRMVDIRCRVERLDSLSAHADQGELMQWLGGFRRPPALTLLNHGEPDALGALRDRIAADLGWTCRVAKEGERVAVPPGTAVA